MADLLLTLPYDPTGSAATNRITNEQHVVNPLSYRENNFIVPKMAPFFIPDVGTPMPVRFVDNDGNSRLMVLGQDYYFGFKFYTASRAVGRPVYGGIVLLDNTLVGTIVIDRYQSIGGNWTLSTQEYLELIADRLHNPKIVMWESVVDIPVYFEPVDHDWRILDMVGMGDVSQKLITIEEAIRQSSTGSINEHILNRENPHEVTKDQVLLGLVRNLTTATQAIAQAGTSDDYYMTPLRTRQAIASQALAPLTAHTQATGNVHGMIAADINAYNKLEVDALIEELRNTGLAAEDSQRFGGRTPAEYSAWVLTGTAANSTQLAGQTLAQVIASVKAGITVDDISGAVSETELNAGLATKLGTTGTAYNSDRLGSMTAAAYKADVLTGTAANAAKLENQTLAEITTSIKSSLQVTDVTGAASAQQLADGLAEKLDATATAADSAKLGARSSD